MDSKGLFDALDNDLPQDDRKSSIGGTDHRRIYASRTLSTSMVSAQSKCSRRHDKVQGCTFRAVVQLVTKGEKNELADRAVQRRTAIKAVSESTFFVHTPLGLREIAFEEC